MDDRGRIAQPLKRADKARSRIAERRQKSGRSLPREDAERSARTRARAPSRSRWERITDLVGSICGYKIPRGAGVAGSAAIILVAVSYGVLRGEHWPAVVVQLADARDALANVAGFRITEVAIAGEKETTRDEILSIAGVSGRTSLLFLNAEAARDRLKANPWIADAALLKLYPGRLDLSVKERQAFALWQKDHQIGVIAADGVVVQPFVDPRFSQLPLVVGTGAAEKARAFLALLDRYPDIRAQVTASILVAERRWNLRLKNGVDVRLPEDAPEQALEQLVSLDREKRLLSRDIVAIDLRLPDRVTVRLSDEAAAARAEALKDKKNKRKGSDA